MKRFLLAFIIIFICVSPGFAFLYQLELLTSEEIKELTDVQLWEVYVEAKVEEKASGEFHRGAGFSNAKEYEKRKELLRYIIYLRKEFNERDIEVDPIEEWLD